MRELSGKSELQFTSSNTVVLLAIGVDLGPLRNN
jgi:hypothetical protein